MKYYGIISKPNGEGQTEHFAMAPGANRTRAGHEHLQPLLHVPFHADEAMRLWIKAYRTNMVESTTIHDDGSRYIYFLGGVAMDVTGQPDEAGDAIDATHEALLAETR